jgi:ergothioneine biosynthesis protein EgtB
MASILPQREISSISQVTELYKQVRARTMQIVAPLEIEDYVIQTAEFMSPPRWHIGHTSWFFETLLQEFQAGYRVYSEEFLWYFNSYYEGFGARIERPKRGTKSRPTVRATVAYRNHVDEQILKLLDSLERQAEAEKILSLVRLGLEHEMQHQELLVYDIKHLLCDQFDAPIQPAPASLMKVEGMAEFAGGLFKLGYYNPQRLQNPNYDFAFDNEKPPHQVWLQDYALARALVTNGDYLEFIGDDGYQNFRFWFSEAWETVKREQWTAPLYWELHDDVWMIRDFSGLHAAKEKANEPVCHVSFFEASAYAKWAGKRLPTEAEWENAAVFNRSEGQTNLFPWGGDAPDAHRTNLFENSLWSPAPVGAFPAGESANGCHQMVGDVWEWTTSDYVPYPGFKCEFNEYNDKWFVNQKVLRGGSFATPQIHIRSTYRNFFHAHERWMTSGFRCAR